VLRSEKEDVRHGSTVEELMLVDGGDEQETADGEQRGHGKRWAWCLIGEFF